MEWPQANILEYLFPSWWKILGRIRLFDLIGRDVLVGVRFKISKDLAIPYMLSASQLCLKYKLSAVPDIMSSLCHH